MIDMLPLIVIDKNILQAWSHEYLPQKWHFVIPDRLFVEILSNQAFDLAPKLIRHLKLDPHRFSIGRDPLEMIAHEQTYKTTLPKGAYIDSALTDMVREAVHDPPEVLSQRILDARQSKELKLTEEHRQAFMSSCDVEADAVEAMMADDSETKNDIGISDAYLESMVRDPQALMPFIETNSAYNTVDWKKILLVYPDLMAVGRWWRLNLYLWSLRLQNRSDKYINSIDDMYYAFLASYVGAIATSDKGLIRMIRLLYPSVEIHGQI